MDRDELRARLLGRIDLALTSRVLARLMEPADRLALKAVRDEVAADDGLVDKILARIKG